MIYNFAILIAKLMIYVGGTHRLQANKLKLVFCRMLESIIKDDIMVHFDTNHLFYEQLHDFCPMMSCMYYTVTTCNGTLDQEFE